jgi:hypothetical protein
MAIGFLNIPDWFSAENQGAGIALTDLSNSGQQDIIVLMVDNPVGQNQGYYKVGKNLDQDGNVSNGWSNWTTIPDWFSTENQGADIAVADLDGDSHPELIVFMIDNPPGQNAGYYRIGKQLDADGTVTNGWGPWLPIPDWFSWENQYGSITVTDIDHDGQQDLIVFMIDNPPGQNAGYYRIGKKLDVDGKVTGGWSPWLPVPDWFSWENQGTGITIADLDNSGLLDIIIFMIDNPVGQNQAFYKIGKNIQADGTVTGGWGSWLGIPNWFSWENQGSGIATRDVNGQHELFVMMVDHPVGQNAGLYRVLKLDDDPGTRGRWELLPYFSEVLAVHAAVLSTGKVLFFAGAGSSQVRLHSPDFGNMAKGFWTSVVWDPATAPLPNTDNNFFHPATIRDEHGITYDFFCGGDSFLSDGRLLQAGGSADYPRDGHGFLGLKNSFLFNPQTEQWTQVQAMAHGRWYPTLITLPDGNILATSGINENGNLNTTLEIYSPQTNTWQELPVPPLHEFLGLPLYAHLFVMQDGQIFFTGGRMDDPSPLGPSLLDITQQPVRVTPIQGLNNANSRNQSASVLLPPAQDQKVLIMGGGPEDETDATDSCNIVDLSIVNPLYRAVTSMNLPRMHLNAVLLPDHTVFVSGGALKREFKIAARLQSEIYDPATDTWRIGATAAVPRMYHSIALLLPDGRVIAAGSNPQGGNQVAWLPPDPNEELRMELYSPPYLFKGPRPLIDAAPVEWKYGATVIIQSQQSETIRWISLIKSGVTTHSFNNGQRLVDLSIISQEPGMIKATVTDKPAVAPPGWYMLFITDTNGIPSVAHWVHLTSN